MVMSFSSTSGVVVVVVASHQSIKFFTRAFGRGSGIDDGGNSSVALAVSIRLII